MIAKKSPKSLLFFTVDLTDVDFFDIILRKESMRL